MVKYASYHICMICIFMNINKEMLENKGKIIIFINGSAVAQW